MWDRSTRCGLGTRLVFPVRSDAHTSAHRPAWQAAAFMPDAMASCLQSFSSVVGPNGSGKSNVIDAMLFVFGRRAKQVR